VSDDAGDDDDNDAGGDDGSTRQSSSLNRRTSPDHIPRIHECWSLEPVRRAHNTRGGAGGSHRVGGGGTSDLPSDVSSLDSLPATSTRPSLPLAAHSELPTGEPLQ